ncbi:hypothetical protein SAMN05428977_101442 [Nitrosomonas sp. Nm166]|nr:hypothetical protein SAMN05428977_101442 [Nitrosomonas sp. Nm166]
MNLEKLSSTDELIGKLITGINLCLALIISNEIKSSSFDRKFID